MNKFNAKRTEVDGISFASKKEAKRYGELKLLERGKAITDLKLQPRIDCVVAGQKICTYVADFFYIPRDTFKPVWEDAKGMKTPIYKLKKKLVLACTGIEITET